MSSNKNIRVAMGLLMKTKNTSGKTQNSGTNQKLRQLVKQWCGNYRLAQQKSKTFNE